MTQLVNLNEFVIVVGRECGSGGRELGRELATRLGVPYYDKSLLQEAASEQGISRELFEKHDERKPSVLKSMMAVCLGVASDPYPGDSFSGNTLQVAVGRTVRRIMETGGCVIVGRAADYIGRDLRNMVSIFLHADMPYKVAKVKAREQCSDSDEAVAEKLRKIDSRRHDYYNYFTGRNWGVASNYHLTFNTARLPMSSIADLVIDYLKKRGEAMESAEENMSKKSTEDK